eukprot:scaffold12986_cov68-Cyclotella_meneghiniana.AAC.8
MSKDSPTSFMKFASNMASKTPPKQQRSGGGQNSNHNPYSNGRGRGRSGGRNNNQGRGGFKGRGNSKYVPDPWLNVEHAKPVLTPAAQKVLDEIIKTRPKCEVYEEDLKGLTIRERDIIALCVLMMKIVDKTRSVRFNYKNIQGLRDRSRAQMIAATTSDEKLDKMINFLKLGQWPFCNQHTPPVMYADLIADTASIFRRVDEANLTDKPKIIYDLIIDPYLKRHFNPSEAIKNLMRSISKMDYSNMSSMATVKSAMCKYIWKAAGTGTKFEPLDMPSEMDEVLWNIATAPLDDYEEGNTNDNNIPANSFAEMVAKATEVQSQYNNKFKVVDETKDNYEDTQSELDEKENSSTVLEQIKEVTPEEENEADIQDDSAVLEAIRQSQEEASKTPATKENKAVDTETSEQAQKATIEKAIEVFECSIERPNDMIKLDQDILLTMEGEELKMMIRQKLTSYLASHYSVQGPEISELIMKLPVAGIASLITTEGKMSEFLKRKGYSPSKNLDIQSPGKVYGSNPLASNKIRRFQIRISQTNGPNEVEKIAMTVASTLIDLAGKMENHILALCPSNPSSMEPNLWDKESLLQKVTGWSEYIGNIDHITWQKKLQVDIIIETSLDVAYVLNVTSARTSPECEAFNSFLKAQSIILKIIDVEENIQEPAALAVRMNRYYDEKKCIAELRERLRETSSYEVAEGSINIKWRMVAAPSDEILKIVMGTIEAQRSIAAIVTDKLLDLNSTPQQELYPHTGNWIFHRGKEDDGAMNTMKEGIRCQRDYMEQTETITVVGLGYFPLKESTPVLKVNGHGNSSGHTAAQLIVLEDVLTRAGNFEASPFDGVYEKPNGSYVFTGSRKYTSKMRDYFREGAFLSSLILWGFTNHRDQTVKAFWRKLPENDDNTTEHTIIDPQSMDHVNGADMEEVAESQVAPAIPLGHPPPISYQDQFQRPPQYEQVDGKKVNPKAHYEGPQHNPYYDPLNDKTHAELNRWSMAPSKNIEVPKFPGTIGHEGLEYIVNSILEQFRTYIPKITEDAWSVCDPAARLVSLLIHRDQALLSCINDTLDTNMRRIIGEIYNESSEDTDQINNMRGTGVPPTPVSNLKYTEGTAMSQSEFHTPGGELMSPKVSTDIRKLAHETSAFMEDERRKFDGYNSKLNVSGINQEEDDDNIKSPSTDNLKRELANETTLTNWSQEISENDMITNDAIDEHLREQDEKSKTKTSSTVEITEKAMAHNNIDMKLNSKETSPRENNNISPKMKEDSNNSEDKVLQEAESGESSASSGLPIGINDEDDGTAKIESTPTKRITHSRRCKSNDTNYNINSTGTGKDAT